MSSKTHRSSRPGLAGVSARCTLGAAALGLFMSFGGALSANGESADVELGEWYTAEQAERGGRSFAANCGTCHGDEMLEYFESYETAQEFYSYIQSSMPVDNPGGLSARNYIEITAYILSRAGFPAGDEPLTADRELLEGITPVLIAGNGADEGEG